VKNKDFNNIKEAQEWAHKEGRKDGYCYTISYDKNTKTYIVIVYVWVKPILY